MIDLHVHTNCSDGVECYHKAHSIDQSEYLKEVCRKNNLLMSGGSDFHREKDVLGHCNGYKDLVPDRIVEGWI